MSALSLTILSKTICVCVKSNSITALLLPLKLHFKTIFHSLITGRTATLTDSVTTLALLSPNAQFLKESETEAECSSGDNVVRRGEGTHQKK